MPRSTSLRKQLLNRLDELCLVAVKHGVRLKIIGVATDQVNQLMCRCRQLKMRIANRRHLSRGRQKKRTGKFNCYLDTTSDDCLSDNEFRFHFRVTREVFIELMDLLKCHPAFQRKNSDSRGPPPKPVAHQLLVSLKYCGCEGNQASSIALSNFFGVASGVIDNCRNNALKAALSLEAATHIWPDAEERRLMAI